MGASVVVEHRLLRALASVAAARGRNSCRSRALKHRLSSCGIQALLLHDTWDLPRAGIKPMSPAFAGRFSTTEPPGKPLLPVLTLYFSYPDSNRMTTHIEYSFSVYCLWSQITWIPALSFTSSVPLGKLFKIYQMQFSQQ